MIDLPATVLSAAGIEVPDSYQGIPLNKMLCGNAKAHDGELIQISESCIGRAVRTARYKFCAVGAGRIGGTSKPDCEIYSGKYLYDLQNDPHENNNLIDDLTYAQIRTDLSILLRDRIYQIEGKTPQII